MQLQEIAERWGPTFLYTQRKYKKDYSYASQPTILANTSKYRNITKSRSQLCRDERKLEDKRYLLRIQRTKRDPVRGLIHNSTIVILGMKMYHALARMGINVKKEMDQLLAKLRIKYPEFAAKSTKKKLEASKRNIQHEEFMCGIVEKLEKRHVIE